MRKSVFKTHKKLSNKINQCEAKLRMKQSKFTFVKLTNGKTLRAGNSKISDKWLDSLNVKEREKPINYFGKIYIADGFNNNVIYEMLGDYFHGSHKKFPTNRNILLKQLGKTPEQLYRNTIERFIAYTNLGCKVFFVWESQYKNGFVGRYFRGPGDNLY